MRLIAAAMSLVTFAATVPSAAQEKEACVAASESAQKLRSQKKLRAARKELVKCAQEACPGIVKKDCATWLSEVDDSLPTVILSARDATGADVADVRVLLDGEVLTEKLEGSAIAIDPGPHTFRFESSKGDPVETSVLVREAEKNRSITATIGKPVVAAQPSPTAPPTTVPETQGPSRPIPTGTYVFGAVAAASFVGFAYFGLSGRADRDRLLDTCAPYCNKADEKPARTKLAVADISLAVGVVSLAVATVLILMPRESREREPSKTALRVDAVPIAGGAVGMLGGSF